MDKEGKLLEQRLFAVFKTPDDYKPAERLGTEKKRACASAWDDSEAPALYAAIDDRKWEDTPLDIFTGLEPSTAWLSGDALLYYFPCFLLVMLREPEDGFYLATVIDKLRTSKREPWKHKNVVLLAKFTDDKIAVIVDVVRYVLNHLDDELDSATKKRAPRTLALFLEGIAYHRGNRSQP
jgi:hypothetical protein